MIALLSEAAGRRILPSRVIGTGAFRDADGRGRVVTGIGVEAVNELLIAS